jgi:hypothetical protein
MGDMAGENVIVGNAVRRILRRSRGGIGALRLSPQGKAVLLSRTTHAAMHEGQMRLAGKK